MTTNTDTQKIEALAKYLNIEAAEVSEGHDEVTFEAEGCEYLILSDSEADDMAEANIKQSLWAFNAEFIASHTKKGLNNGAIEALRRAQSELCEDANDLVESMIEDLPHFIQDAISCDGRGHFMNSYDGEEIEAGEFFIYRMN